MKKLLMVFFLGISLVFPSGKAAAASVQHFSLPFGTGPQFMIPGPGKEMWFTEDAVPQLGSISATGKIHTYPIGVIAHGIAYDQKTGRVWFSADPDVLGYRTFTGKVILFHTRNTATPFNLLLYRGNIWFLAGSNSYGFVTATGQIREYTFPGTFQSAGMAVGSDGNLWVTDAANTQIGKLTCRGQLTLYPIPHDPHNPSGDGHPKAITQGPDRAMWFVEIGKVGRITTRGVVTLFPSQSLNAEQGAIIAGPDKTLWYSGDGFVLHMTTEGKEEGVTGLGGRYATQGLAVGYDQNIWFTATEIDQIGRILLS